jgi:trigger factor
MSEITVEKTAEDVASKSLRVTVPVDRVRAAESKALRAYSQQARLPGFRPGKAPEAVVRKRFGDAIRQSVLEEVLRDGWEMAKSTESLKPIADPSVRNLKFEEGSPIEFDLVVEVRPELKLERVAGFRIQRPPATVDDTQLSEQLDRLREQKATWTPVEGEQPRPGEMVRVEVAPMDGDTPGTAQSHDIVLGQNQALPQLEERVMALRPGETADVELTIPEDHPDPARRGSSRRVRVTLHEVKRQDLPPLDDALAREVGDFESLDALKQAVREDLEQSARRESDAQVRQQLIQQIVEANQVPAPESLVHRVLHAYAHMYKVPDEQMGTFEQQFHPIAEQQVRRDLVLDALVDQHDLRASEADVDAKVNELAEARGVPAGQLYASLQKANRLADIERSLTEDKIFAFLLPQSTVEEGTK